MRIVSNDSIVVIGMKMHLNEPHTTIHIIAAAVAVTTKRASIIVIVVKVETIIVRHDEPAAVVVVLVLSVVLAVVIAPIVKIVAVIVTGHGVISTDVNVSLIVNRVRTRLALRPSISVKVAVHIIGERISKTSKT